MIDQFENSRRFHSFMLLFSFICSWRGPKFLNRHQKLKMSESQLPTELLYKIFAYLPVRDISSSSTVCRRWKEIAEKLFNQRNQIFMNEANAGNLDPKFIEDLNSYFFSRPTPWKVLSKYEETRLRLNGGDRAVPYIEGGDDAAEFTKNFERFIMHIMKEWYDDYAANPGANETFDLNDKIKFIPSHKLVFYLTPMPKVVVYHQMDIFNFVESESVPSSNNLVPYKITYPKSYLGNQIEEIFVDVSVYNDTLVMKCLNTRRLMYCQITNVEHDKRELELTPLREIFLPWHSLKIILFKIKIFITFESNSSLAVWEKSTNNRENVFEEELTILNMHVNVPLSIIRLNNWIFFKPRSSLAQRRWYLIDGDQDIQDESALESISNIDDVFQTLLVKRFLWTIKRVHLSVTNLHLQNNMMIAHLQRFRFPGISAVLVMQLLQPLTRDHFDIDSNLFGQNIGTCKIVIQKAERSTILPIPFKPNVKDSSKLLLTIIPNGSGLSTLEDEGTEFDYKTCMSNNYIGGKILYKITDNDSPLPFTPVGKRKFNL